MNNRFLCALLLTSLGLLTIGCCGIQPIGCRSCGPVRTALMGNPLGCRGGCGEMYVDEYINEPPVLDPCDACGSQYTGPNCGIAPPCRPLLTRLGRLWGIRYMGGGCDDCGLPGCSSCGLGSGIRETLGSRYSGSGMGCSSCGDALGGCASCENSGQDFGEYEGHAGHTSSCNCGQSHESASHIHQPTQYRQTSNLNSQTIPKSQSRTSQPIAKASANSPTRLSPAFQKQNAIRLGTMRADEQ